jgi:microcystin-dependent protein
MAAAVVPESMQIQIEAGVVVIPAAEASLGAWLCASDAPERIAIDTAPPVGQDRIDLIAATVSDGDDPGWTWQAQAGAPSASPVSPVPAAGTIPICAILVRGGAAVLSSGDIVDRRPAVSAGVDVGDIKLTARPVAPVGWLLCNGAAISRVQFAALFAAIGGTYGAGDGATTFNLPNLGDRVALGASPSRGPGAIGGAEWHVLSIAEMPFHDHPHFHGPGWGDFDFLTVSNAPNFNWNWVGGSGQGISARATTDSSTSSPQGGNAAHNNMPPFVAMNYVIKF